MSLELLLLKSYQHHAGLPVQDPPVDRKKGTEIEELYQDLEWFNELGTTTQPLDHLYTLHDEAGHFSVAGGVDRWYDSGHVSIDHLLYFKVTFAGTFKLEMSIPGETEVVDGLNAEQVRIRLGEFIATGR